MHTPRTRMHTAEHILSAIMRLEYGADRNVELHLGDKKTKCDYCPNAPLQDGDIEQIQRRVNDEILANHPVGDEIIARSEATEYDLWKVPADAETIRIVNIGTLDAQPCSGEHVSNTQEIGEFRVTTYENRDNGRTRIRFKVGAPK